MKNYKNEFPLTNPNKILYPEKKITKQDLANYYLQIQDWILPYIVKRPLTVVRCPNGRENCFYQKHLTEKDDENFYSINIKEKHDTQPYLYIKDIGGLMALVQLGVLEIHPWGSRIDNIEKPDMITFDLDPAPDIEWRKVIKGANIIREELEKNGLTSFIKTTGGKGLHVVIPFQRQYDWEIVGLFAETFTEYVVSLYPDLFLANMRKEKRKKKIFLDYLRNRRGATAVAPYSTRARENAPVATPIHWDELTKVKPAGFTIHNILKRLEKLKSDPWKDFFTIKQKLKIPK